MKKALKTLSYLFGCAIKYKPSYLLIYILDIIVKSGMPFINVIFPKYLIDELLIGKRIEQIVIYTACIVVGNFVMLLLSVVLQEKLNKHYYDDFSRYFDAMLSRKNMSISFRKTEDKEVLEYIQRAREGLGVQAGGIGGIAGSISQLIINVIISITSIVLLIQKAFVVILIVIASVVIAYYANQKMINIQLKYFDQIAENNRGYEYALVYLTNFKYGKDVRLYHAEDMMLEKIDQFNQKTASIGAKQASEKSKWLTINGLTMALREGSTFFYLGKFGLQGVISIADFTMLVNASKTFGNSFSAIVSSIQDVAKKILFATEYYTYMNDTGLNENGGAKHIVQGGEHTIEFKNVSFAYPGSNVKVLDNLSVKISSHEKVSIVGANGAGKTTFIKLLCRLYPVDEGEILLDEININDYELEEYYKSISAVFQDFVLFGFSIKENILLSDSDDVSDDVVFELLDRVGMSYKINELPEGINTNIYRFYDKNGFEPSGGEQQKIAIARALYNEGEVVILDEPTAALDPISEAEIYEKFNDMVCDKMSLLISHRLSSCKFCDRILVFEQGKIVEDGTHESLVNCEGGIYANMFHVQAQYYQS